MILYSLFLLIFLLIKVNSDTISDSIWRDVRSNPINVTEYCKDRKCIIKCCPKDFVIFKNKCQKPKKAHIKKLITYSEYEVYKLDAATNKQISTNKKLINEFVFIQNDFFSNLSVARVLHYPSKYYILEDGSIIFEDPKYSSLDKLGYCVELTAKIIKDQLVFKLTSRGPITEESVDNKIKAYYVATGMLTSSVFMILILCVYCALPRLRNIVGMSLMAYLVSLICGYVMKAIQLIGMPAGFMGEYMCRLSSPAIYFFIMGSFFWLNVMSFDLWWTIRGTRKHRDIHRQGELMKFIWYCVYAWGTSLLLTLTLVAVDRFELTGFNYKPPFDCCFVDQLRTGLYLHLPIAIITVANLILFLLTAYNVWLVKKAIRDVNDNRTKSSENRFIIYIKLLVLMGVGWILELIPDLPLAPYIIINFFNMFIGVIMFIIFVCKKSIISMLCKRFNIHNRFVDKLGYPQGCKSESTKSSNNQNKKILKKKFLTMPML